MLPLALVIKPPKKMGPVWPRFIRRVAFGQQELNEVRTKYSTAVWVAISASALILFPAVAATVTERERQDCRADYQRYCKVYAVGSEALRACMSRSVKRLSHVCVDALVDAGEMTRAQADKLRKKTEHPKRPTHKRPHKYSHKKSERVPSVTSQKT
jgi:hypothetical protein